MHPSHKQSSAHNVNSPRRSTTTNQPSPTNIVGNSSRESRLPSQISQDQKIKQQQMLILSKSGQKNIRQVKQNLKQKKRFYDWAIHLQIVSTLQNKKYYLPNIIKANQKYFQACIIFVKDQEVGKQMHSQLSNNFTTKLVVRTYDLRDQLKKLENHQTRILIVPNILALSYSTWLQIPNNVDFVLNMDIYSSASLYQQKVAKVLDHLSYKGGIVINFLTKDSYGNIDQSQSQIIEKFISKSKVEAKNLELKLKDIDLSQYFKKIRQFISQIKRQKSQQQQLIKSGSIPNQQQTNTGNMNKAQDNLFQFHWAQYFTIQGQEKYISGRILNYITWNQQKFNRCIVFVKTQSRAKVIFDKLPQKLKSNVSIISKFSQLQLYLPELQQQKLKALIVVATGAQFQLLSKIIIPSNVNLILNNSLVGSLEHYQRKVKKYHKANSIQWKGAVVNFISSTDENKIFKQFSEKHQINSSCIDTIKGYDLSAYFVQIKPNQANIKRQEDFPLPQSPQQKAQQRTQNIQKAHNRYQNQNRMHIEQKTEPIKSAHTSEQDYQQNQTKNNNNLKAQKNQAGVNKNAKQQQVPLPNRFGQKKAQKIQQQPTNQEMIQNPGTTSLKGQTKTELISQNAKPTQLDRQKKIQQPVEVNNQAPVDTTQIYVGTQTNPKHGAEQTQNIILQNNKGPIDQNISQQKIPQQLINQQEQKQEQDTKSKTEHKAYKISNKQQSDPGLDQIQKGQNQQHTGSKNQAKIQKHIMDKYNQEQILINSVPNPIQKEQQQQHNLPVSANQPKIQQTFQDQTSQKQSNSLSNLIQTNQKQQNNLPIHNATKIQQASQHIQKQEQRNTNPVLKQMPQKDVLANTTISQQKVQYNRVKGQPQDTNTNPKVVINRGRKQQQQIQENRLATQQIQSNIYSTISKSISPVKEDTENKTNQLKQQEKLNLQKSLQKLGDAANDIKEMIMQSDKIILSSICQTQQSILNNIREDLPTTICNKIQEATKQIQHRTGQLIKPSKQDAQQIIQKVSNAKSSIKEQITKCNLNTIKQLNPKETLQGISQAQKAILKNIQADLPTKISNTIQNIQSSLQDKTSQLKLLSKQHAQQNKATIIQTENNIKAQITLSSKNTSEKIQQVKLQTVSAIKQSQLNIVQKNQEIKSKLVEIIEESRTNIFTQTNKILLDNNTKYSDSNKEINRIGQTIKKNVDQATNTTCNKFVQLRNAQEAVLNRLQSNVTRNIVSSIGQTQKVILHKLEENVPTISNQIQKVTVNIQNKTGQLINQNKKSTAEIIQKVCNVGNSIKQQLAKCTQNTKQSLDSIKSQTWNAIKQSSSSILQSNKDLADLLTSNDKAITTNIQTQSKIILEEEKRNFQNNHLKITNTSEEIKNKISLSTNTTTTKLDELKNAQTDNFNRIQKFFTASINKNMDKIIGSHSSINLTVDAEKQGLNQYLLKITKHNKLKADKICKEQQNKLQILLAKINNKQPPIGQKRLGGQLLKLKNSVTQNNKKFEEISKLKVELAAVKRQLEQNKKDLQIEKTKTKNLSQKVDRDKNFKQTHQAAHDLLVEILNKANQQVDNLKAWKKQQLQTRTKLQENLTAKKQQIFDVRQLFKNILLYRSTKTNAINKQMQQQNKRRQKQIMEQPLNQTFSKYFLLELSTISKLVSGLAKATSAIPNKQSETMMAKTKQYNELCAIWSQNNTDIQFKSKSELLMKSFVKFAGDYDILKQYNINILNYTKQLELKVKTLGEKSLLAYNKSVQCRIEVLNDYNLKVSQANKDLQLICECLNKFAQERIKLKKQLQKLNSQNQNQIIIINNLNDEKRSLQSKRDQLQAIKTNNEKTINQMKQELSNLKQQYQEATNNYNKLIQCNIQQIANKEKEIGRLKQTIKLKQIQILKLENELKNVKQKARNDEIAAKRQMKKMKDDYEAQIDQYKNSIKNLQNAKTKLQKDMAQAIQKLKQQKEQQRQKINKQNQQKLGTLRQQFQKQKQKIFATVNSFEGAINTSIKSILGENLQATLDNFKDKIKLFETNAKAKLSRIVFLNDSLLYRSMNQQDKKFIYDAIQRVVPKKIAYTTCLLEGYDGATFSEWPDKAHDKQNILLIMTLQNGYKIGGFSQHALTPKIGPTGRGFLMSITNKKIYNIKPKYQGRAGKHDEYFVSFGNNELVVKSTLQFSVIFKSVYSFFDTGSDKIVDFIGQQKDKGNYQRVQVYHIIFE